MIRTRSRWTCDNVAVVIGRAALGLGLALALALLAALAVDAAQPEAPYTCRLYYEAERNCGAFGNCDRRAQERLKRECLRDGGRP